jgi:hypothetical protein
MEHIKNQSLWTVVGEERHEQRWSMKKCADKEMEFLQV